MNQSRYIRSVRRRDTLRSVLVAAVAAGWLLFSTQDVSAQKRAPVTIPTAKSPFNRAEVIRLLARAEIPSQAVELKQGYFTHQLPGALPIAQGLELVTRSLRASKSHSARWFALGGIRAYALLRSNSKNRLAGFIQYRDVFLKAREARDMQSKTALYALLSDFCDTMAAESGKSYSEGLSPLPQQTVAKAWSAYIEVCGTVAEDTQAPLPWNWTIFDNESEKQVYAELQRQLTRLEAERTYGFYYAIATTTRSVPGADRLFQPHAFLAAAEKLKPSTDPAMEFEKIRGQTPNPLQGPDAVAHILRLKDIVLHHRAYHAAFLDLFQYNYIPGEAVKLAREAVWNSLNEPTTPETEIVAVTHNQFRSYSFHRGSHEESAKLVTMLKAYLASKRVRTPRHELSMRIMLGEIYRDTGKIPDALRVLSEARQPRATDGRLAQARYQIIQSMLATLKQKKNSGA